MEDVLTVEQISKCVADAANYAILDVHGDAITQELNKAWNRGVQFMESFVMLYIRRQIEANRRANK